MEIKRVPISKIKPWDKNPRNITETDFGRLKKQIKRLGLYKPLLVFEENGGYITLGGNMRLRALLDLKQKEVEVSIVHPKTEAAKIEYSLSDNDRAGEYDELQLAELIYPVREEIALGEFKLDLGRPVDLENLLGELGPEDGDYSDLDGELQDEDDFGKATIELQVPRKFEEPLREWLRTGGGSGNHSTSRGLGNGALVRAGLIGEDQIKIEEETA